jgi:hypothetical protein
VGVGHSVREVLEDEGVLSVALVESELGAGVRVAHVLRPTERFPSISRVPFASDAIGVGHLRISLERSRPP